ncbi:hypothetical protein [Pedobacter chitinilyticus]|uniref:Uncharacterized protein n=1 Tax=Pedobacter chitinilyticus TaxID=2233776 RepID=A0A443Z1J5_9SPHI|nr:hypothetical protein [Pedobacter chitinilyticus]RWU10394.1 hypothetical protein DPV69_03375 [Pedobacter chitinilyticus]
MKRLPLLFIVLIIGLGAFAQELKLKKRKADALTGSQFSKLIVDTNISLSAREEMIWQEVKNGNIPSFLRKLSPIEINKVIDIKNYQLIIYTTSDYLSIGTDTDYIYMPTTPMLAQRIANLTHTLLPTKSMVDEIYRQAIIKLEPQPIPPTKAMTTVPVFRMHHEIVQKQLQALGSNYKQGSLTAGNKKDIIISNKIYRQATPRVVIYGWHKLDGKAIQPVYNKHTNTWADYSHGVRLISNIGYLNGKKIKLTDLLKDPILHELLSDEGMIMEAKYPID